MSGPTQNFSNDDKMDFEYEGAHVDIPLDFWLCNSYNDNEQQKQAQKKLHEKALKLVGGLLYPCSMPRKYTYTIEDYIQILDELDALDGEFMLTLGLNIPIMYPAPEPFKWYKEVIKKELTKTLPEWYKVPIIFTNDDAIKYGLKENDIGANMSNWFRYDYFLELEKLFNETDLMSKDCFVSKCKGHNELGKMDNDGEYYKGYWSYPDGSDEKENAYALSVEANANALWKLPYSHSLILKTVEHSINHLQYSVKFCELMCEYIKRKLEIKKNMIK